MTLDAPVSDLKLVYRVLHQHLAEHLELMDNALFEQLQTRLQAQAKLDGVNVADHGAWDAWLGKAAERRN
jgi:hypothetical protein